MKNILLTLAFLSISFFGFSGCNPNKKESSDTSKKIPVNFNAKAEVESDPVPGVPGQDAADDPAIWYNEHNPEKSLVFGTDKKGGIIVFDLEGRVVKYHSAGLPNNIDIRNGFRLDGKRIDIAGFTNRKLNRFEIYRIEPDGNIISLTGDGLKPEFKGEVYGFCLYHDRKKNRFYAFVNSKEGDLEQWRLNGSNAFLETQLVKSYKFGSQVEGMVADDENGILFVGEEDTGIWSAKLSNRKSLRPVLLPEGIVGNNLALEADIEGLALSYSVSGGYLIASSQGNNSYAIFNRNPPHHYVGSFTVSCGNFDGTEETDGIEICNLPLNKKFPSGIFIAQDGVNTDNNNDTIPQNFKFISWSCIIRTLHNAGAGTVVSGIPVR